MNGIHKILLFLISASFDYGGYKDMCNIVIQGGKKFKVQPLKVFNLQLITT